MNATELSRRLGQQAEAVCRHYLSNGRKEGRYWLVGNVDNAPGRSLYVRLVDGEKGPAGKWTDAATGDHGDLLDIIDRSVRAAGGPGLEDRRSRRRISRFGRMPQRIRDNVLRVSTR